MDDKKFSDGLNDAESKGKKFGTSFGTIAGNVGKGFVKLGGITAKALAAGTAAFAGLAAKALNLSGELEQNLGGAEAVFGRFADSIKTKGETAFKDMGLSMSEFLATANKMGALFQGSGFGIEESADLATSAMQRAADVASIMGIDVGTAMEAVAGAAKGNFTMMDNLGVAINETTLANYALEKGIRKSTTSMTTQEKVALAMELFMEKSAYAAGNYAKENDTLAGSLTTAKAAMENFLTGAGNVDDFVDSVVNLGGIVAENLTQLVPRLTAGVAEVIQQLIPALPPLIQALLPAIIEGGSTLITGLLDAMPSIMTALGDVIPMAATAILTMLPELLATGVSMLAEIISGISGALPTLIPAAVEAVTSLVTALIDNAPKLLEAAVELITKLATSIIESLPVLVAKAPELISALGDAIIAAIPTLVTAGGEIIKTIGEGLGDISPIFQPISDALILIGENFDVVVAALAGAAAAFGAYKLVTIASTAATSGFGVVQAALAAKTAIVTAATWLWNAALNANPVGLVVGAVVGLGVALGALATVLKRASQEQKDLDEAIKQNNESFTALNEALATNAASFSENVADIDANAAASSKLAEQVYALADAENKSAEDKQKLAAMVDMLNAAMPELGLAYDAEADALSKSAEQTHAYIEAKKEQAKLAAINERAVEVAKELVDIELQLAEVAQLKDTAYRMALEGEGKTLESMETLAAREAELITSREERSAALEGLANMSAEASAAIVEHETIQADAVTGTTDAVVEATDAMVEAYAKQDEIAAARAASDEALTNQMILNANELGMTLEEYKEHLSKIEQEEAEINKKREETLAAYTKAATDMFSTINEKSETSVSQMISNLEKNKQAMENWATNIQTLVEKGLNPELLQELLEKGPEAVAGEVAALAKATPEQLEKVNTAFEGSTASAETAHTAVDTALTGMETNATDAETTITDATGEITTATEDASTAVEDMQGVMGAAGEAMTAWVEDVRATSGTDIPEAISAIMLSYEDLSTKIADVYNRVTEETEIWAASLVSTAARAMPPFVEAVISAVRPVVAQMRTIGSDMIRGWGEGMDSQQGWFFSKLKAFTDKIVSDVKSALDIKSPSGVFKEIGIFSGEGYIGGLFSMKDAIGDAIQRVFVPDADLFGEYTPSASAPHTIASAASMANNAVQPVTVNQYIEAVPQTPAEFGAITALHFDRARWVTA